MGNICAKNIPICSTYSGKIFETIPSPSFLPTSLPESLMDAVPWCLKSRNTLEVRTTIARTTDEIITCVCSMMKNGDVQLYAKDLFALPLDAKMFCTALLGDNCMLEIYCQALTDSYMSCFAKVDSYMSCFAKRGLL